jgi:uncharacterized membrane protein
MPAPPAENEPSGQVDRTFNESKRAAEPTSSDSGATKSADLQRLASLSDCVFAVAMTLLTFSVRIPDHGVDPAKLPGELTRMWSESFGLVLSFAIAGMFWVGHFRLLRSLRRATFGLIYLNLFQLFWIAVLPISTSLWIRNELRETTLVIEANLTLIALSAFLMWLYSYRTGLFEPGALVRLRSNLSY